VLFLIAAAAIGFQVGDSINTNKAFYGMTCGLGFGMIIIMLEWVFTKRFIHVVSTIMFGLLFGFVLSYLFITPLLHMPWIAELSEVAKVWLQFGITLLFSYLSVVVIIKTKDDFKFVVPFIELKREDHASRPWILDTSSVIDGRIADVLEAQMVDQPMIIPRFVLDELQGIADSGDKLKRARGRRGLDILNRIRTSDLVDLQISDQDYPDLEQVDAKLVRIAKSLGGKIVTNDFNLNKVARVQGVSVVNINDLAKALKPVVIPGETIAIRIVKPGEESGQGVGYLDDGTMVVGERCGDRINEEVSLTVTSVLQTSAGRMIFGALGENGQK
jgi:uncharacterized protein YacL